MPESKYGPETIDRICEQLIEGRPLAEICREDGMPNRVTVWRWGKADDEIGARLRDAWEVGFLCEGEKMYRAVVQMAFKDPHAARAMLDAAKWHLGRRSASYADKPLVGVQVNVDAGDAFDAVQGVLDQAAAAISSSGHSTQQLVDARSPGPGDACGNGLADMAGAGGAGLGEDQDRS